MPINVLHISTPASFRGGEQQVSYLINSLVKFDITQFLICPKKAMLNDKIDIEKCTIINHKKIKFISISLIIKTINMCFDNDISIIHAHDSKAQTVAVFVAFFSKKKIKVVVTRRVLFAVKGWLSKFKYKIKNVNKIICISKAVELEMRKIVNLEKTIIISSAINLNKFNTVDKKNFLFFKDSNIRVAYVAALTYEKDHITFLKTAKLILKTNKNITFYIVGEGKMRNEIIAIIQKMNLENNVVLTGFIKNISSFILQMDYLLFTSRYEGLGTTILDFYLAKKPVITTLCGGNNEISLHKKTAMVSKVGDYKSLAKNFIALHQNKLLKEKIVAEAYDLVIKNYSVDILGENTFREYKKIVAPKVSI